ncbi:MAG: type I methionyl aminopeptidase [Hydrogenophilus sp.]|nr:type I methionyl aminopeptidase [Hydrogenophilus sp.]
MPIDLKTPQELDAMRVACRLAAEVLDYIEPYVQPGVTTAELDQLCHRYIVDVQNAIPAPLHYPPGSRNPFPNATCTSVNHVVCHGIPNQKPLKKGDILNIDITILKDGWHGDTSRMYIVGGETSLLARRLVAVAYECLWLGIAAVRPGGKLGDIGAAIEAHARRHGFSVVRDYCGHGIGRRFHEEPQVMHVGKPGTGITLQPGMTFTIEPMINAGKPHTSLLADGWTVVTRDRSLSAQWEHTILVTENGVEILTLSPGAPPPPSFLLPYLGSDGRTLLPPAQPLYVP